jgi:hypothetical protein
MAFNPTLRHLTTRLDGGVVWAASTEYLADNIVIYLDASYRCLVNHTSGSSFVTDLLANRWVKLSASVINYIANSSALVDTSGYSTYADAAGAAPVDGTGGSPTVTWTRSTTTPLRGAADFNFTKDAANRQGQGVATDITIDLADRAKVLTVTFDYEVLSGTYADGDLTVYLIADPSGTPVVIQPAGYTVQSATVGTTMRQIATFQTQATGQSYRVCFHVASTSASAYVLAIDNVICGPQSTVQGAAISDWASYTPTIAGSPTPSGTNALNAGRWRRVGDSIELNLFLHMGSTGTAGSATSAIWGLPGGLTVDIAKLSRGNSQTVGNAMFWNTVSESNLIVQATATGVFIETTTGGPVQANNILTNYQIAIVGFLPISGWSSNTVMSNDTDTRVVAMYASTASGTITGTPSDITWSTTTKDTHASFNGVTYTVPVSGYYQISSQVRIAATYVAGNAVGIALNINSANVMFGLARAGGAQVDVSPTLTTIRYLNAGDLVKLQADSSGTSPSFSGGAGYNYLSINRLSGPSAIAASETVALQRYSASGQTINSSVSSIVDFPSASISSVKSIDTHGSWRAASGVYNAATGTWSVTNPGFIAPVSGTYQVSGSVGWAVNTFTTALANVTVCVNGTAVIASSDASNPSAGVIKVCSYSGILKLNAGDVVQIYAFQDTGSARTLQTYTSDKTTFNIIRVGN